MEISFADIQRDKKMLISEDQDGITFIIQDAYNDDDFVSFEVKKSQVKYLVSSIQILQHYVSDQYA